MRPPQQPLRRPSVPYRAARKLVLHTPRPSTPAPLPAISIQVAVAGDKHSFSPMLRRLCFTAVLSNRPADL